VVGGNVSLYNEAPAGPIYPTPVVGMVGKLPDAGRAARTGFVRESDAIALVGPFEPSLKGSELAKLRGEPPDGPLPALDPGATRAAQELVREAVRGGRLGSVHDISEGGVAVALAECCLAGDIGAVVSISGGLEQLFGEAPGRGFIVSGAEEDLAGIGVIIGQVGGSSLEVAGVLSIGLQKLREVRDRGLAQWL
jgi:phosphoribosylformylglycinamidine synthase